MLQISRNCWSMLRSHHNLSQPMDFVFLKPSPTRPQKHSFPCRAKPEDHQGFRGTILYRIKVIPSYHLSPLHNRDLKIWHWGACFTRNSKTVGCRQPYVYKTSSLTKHVQNWWFLGACQPMVFDFVAKWGCRRALQNRRFLGCQPPPILERKLQQG